MAWQAGTSTGGGHHKPQKRTGQVRATQTGQQTAAMEGSVHVACTGVKLRTDTAPSSLVAVPPRHSALEGSHFYIL
jgi:hypothetical protein